jgi:protein SCO1/2
MQRRLLIAFIVLLFGVLLWLLNPWAPADEPWQPHRTLELTAPPAGGDFRLQSAAGPLDLKDLRGRVVLIYFGYTWCPDICPTNLAFIAAALKALAPEELARVQVLFVSVDPERDDAQRLARYTGYFHPRILGLTGTPEEIAEVARRYGAAYRRGPQTDSAMGYSVDHSSYTYAVDPQGRLARTLDHATPPERIAAVVRELLAAEAGQTH